ncbi:MAG: hypothetical protein JSS87_13830 [Acidobacteria bacterium]|nr:hypothetical protein [Acidobacteriota bacterium]
MNVLKKLCFLAAFCVLTSAFLAVHAENGAAPTELPDSPGASYVGFGGQNEVPGNALHASPYAHVIKPTQIAPPQSAADKVLMSLKSVGSIENIGSSAFTAGWSHVWDSRPHYGTDSAGYGERFGASLLKGATQTISRDAIYGNIFHEDTRYYIRGRKYSIGNRAVYAASRVFVTKKDAGGNEIYLANIAAIATSNGLANLYYPTRDQGASQTIKAFGMGFVTNALSNELREFVGDAISLVIHKKK